MGTPPAAQNLITTLRRTPQRMIEGLLGPTFGQKVEGWLGMPLGQTEAPPPQPAQNTGTLPPQWEQADQQSLQQQMKPQRKGLPR